MSRSVNDVDGGVAIRERDVLGQNRDPSLPLEIIRIQDQVVGELIFAKLATLPEQAVHQAGLAMVDMGDDGNIAEVGTRHAAAVCRDGGSVKEGDYGGHEEDRQHRLGTGVAAVPAKSPMVRFNLIIRFSWAKT